MHSEAIEDYLKTIYHLQQGNRQVSTNQLADFLQIRQSSVTNMLKKLADSALIEYEPYQGATLTQQGQEIALRTLRYHRLVEQFLFVKLGLPWEEIHAEAEKWEHVLSPSLANRMDKVLNYPATNPHGAPIPSEDGNIQIPFYITLADIKPPQKIKVAQVHDRDSTLLQYCASIGLMPGETVTLLSNSPYDDMYTIRVNEQDINLGNEVVQNVLFEAVDP
ncbi:MAG: metal-dependent transcriptional regulator [Chloroflexota bacterium]